MLSAFQKLGLSTFSHVTGWYQRSLQRKLALTGLRYHDILVETPEVLLAVERMAPDAKEARARRIMRSVDLNFKRKELPKEMQAEELKVDWEEHLYLADDLELIKEENVERKLLNNF